MSSLYTQHDSNIWKTWLFMSLFFGVVASLGWGISYIYQAPEILWLAVLLSVGMNITSYWYSDKVALALSHARPATREEFFDLYTVTENLSITAGLPMPKLYIIDDVSPNAFATGRNKEHAAVAVTTGLLNRLSRVELEGVIAHELSHIGNQDILLSSVVIVLAGVITIMSDFFLRSRMFSSGDRDRGQGGALIMLIGIVLAILSPLIATIIRLAISRKREFLADASGALLTRYPEGLASALEKISSFGAPLQHATHATAHLFIANPFGGGEGVRQNFLTKLFMTHPPVEERIALLRGSDVS